MAVLCYAQPLNNGICTAYDYFRLSFSATPILISTVNKRLRNLGRIQNYCKIFIYIHKHHNFHRKLCLLKLKIKKLLRKNSTKKLNSWSLVHHIPRPEQTAYLDNKEKTTTTVLSNNTMIQVHHIPRPARRVYLDNKENKKTNSVKQ